jgi:hypothetical protein
MQTGIENGSGLPSQQRNTPMMGTDELFAGSIPEIYDRLLVPLIFEPARSISPAGCKGSSRNMCWRPRQVPAF